MTLNIDSDHEDKQNKILTGGDEEVTNDDENIENIEDEDEEEDKDEENEDEEDDDEENEDDGGDEEIDGEENKDDVDEDDGDECVYRLTKPNKKKKELDINIDIDIEDNFEDEIEENNKNKERIERKTKPYLFDFERVRLLGDRARQLSLGAKPMVKNIDIVDPRAIAKLELEQRIMPLIIVRELPDGTIEKWKLNELKFF